MVTPYQWPQSLPQELPVLIKEWDTPLYSLAGGHTLLYNLLRVVVVVFIGICLSMPLGPGRQTFGGVLSRVSLSHIDWSQSPTSLGGA